MVDTERKMKELRENVFKKQEENSVVRIQNVWSLARRAVEDASYKLGIAESRKYRN